MRRAARLSVCAHRAAIAAVAPGAGEYQVEAAWLHALRSRDAVPAFPPSVAAGANACVPHYHANRGRLRAGELVLIDAGAEGECYAADITRTVPVNGRFSGEQRALYEVVYAAQCAAIAQVRCQRPFSAAHVAAVRVIAEGLCALGLLRGDAEEAIHSGAVQRFFPHKTGHWLGMDVHDVGDYRIDGHSRQLEPGMVVTVEPGVYIAPGSAGVEARWAGIGIRIEDDVAVCRDGPQVLSAGLPRAADAIEALMRA